MKTKVTKKCGVKKCADKKCATKKPCKAKQVKKNVSFTIHADRRKEVYLAGEFNDWNPSAKKMAYKARSGVYTTTIKLASGKYQYKFVIDGVWCADPENADSVANDQGTFNSVITVE